MIAYRRTLLLLLFGCLLIPASAFGQGLPTSLDISPNTVYQVDWPNCYTVTVGDGAYMTIDVLMSYNYAGAEWIPWLTLDGSGQATMCVDQGTPAAHIEIYGVANDQAQYLGYTPVYATLDIVAPSPVISQIGITCDNGDCIWISGSRFAPDSKVLVVGIDPPYPYQYFYGPDLQQSPGFSINAEGTFITLQVTDPTVLFHLGHEGAFVQVYNSNGTVSGAYSVQSPPPVIYSAVAGDADFYRITFSGSFPPNTAINFRIHGHDDDLPNPYSDLVVTPNSLTLRLNPSVRYAFDTSGLDAWAVNMSVHNWSDGYYIPPVDKNITGNIDGISLSGFQYYVWGWACAKTFASSVDVYIYAGGPAGTGTWLGGATANLDSEPGVAAACNSSGSHYRFSVPIPHSMTQYYGGQAIYVHGISPIGLPAYLLGNSGVFTVPSVDRSVTGYIFGAVVENNQYYLKGWACAKTYPGSIDVHLYAGGPSGSGTFVTSTTANLTSTDDPNIATLCNASGTAYRFSIQLTLAMRQQFGGQALYVHGISPFGLANSTIGNSGNINMPAPVATSSKEYIYIGDRLLAVDTTNLP